MGVLNALHMALGRRVITADLIHHSVRDSQYTNDEYQTPKPKFICIERAIVDNVLKCNRCSLRTFDFWLSRVCDHRQYECHRQLLCQRHDGEPLRHLED
jgi:hypothetical protein